MPRKGRKKKSDTSQWPPLTFVSSPLFQPAPVIEQETAVTNPVTAKTVPIDDLTETVWVSPQFSQRGRRMLRSSLSSLRKINSARKSSGMHSAAAMNKKTKFRPLRFLCEDPSEAATSVISTKHLEPIRLATVLAQNRGEDCSLSEDSKNKLSSPRGIDRDKENTDKLSVSAYTTPDRVLRSGHRVSSSSPRKPRRKTRSSEHLLPKTSNSKACTPQGETENLDNPALQQHQTTEDSFETVPCPANFIATPLRADISTDDQSLQLTQPQTAHNQNHLCSPSATSCKSLSSFSPIVPHEHVKRCNNLDPKLRTISHANLWLATPPRSGPDSETVLALDTPVCDYGLGLRQRQLKYGLMEDRQERLVEPP